MIVSEKEAGTRQGKPWLSRDGDLARRFWGSLGNDYMKDVWCLAYPGLQLERSLP
jgi:hypothetical protein